MRVGVKRLLSGLSRLLCVSVAVGQKTPPALRLNDEGYFDMPGLNVMAFQDIYPEGHQAGLSIIQNGVRVATNGDLRLDPTPGQWQPMPKQDKRVVNQQGNEITTWLSSGVGARSMTIAYGFNRADWSYIPGGVSSGTALIRPDFPELKDLFYLWQQGEYVMGGGSSNYMFLVLAADQVLNKK